MNKFKKGDRVKRLKSLSHTHKGYEVIGYNAGGSVIVLPLGKEDHWGNYEIYFEQLLKKF